MLTVSRYLKESADSDDILSGDSTRLKDAFNETTEMVVRARHGITAENLSVFIHTRLLPVLSKAEARYSRVADALWSMKSEMNAVWEDVQRELRVMNAEIKQSCIELQTEAALAAREVQGSLLPQSLDIDRGKVGFFDRGLFVIASGEFCTFVLFCIRFHRKQMRRKWA
jgi:hypothetical protein